MAQAEKVDIAIAGAGLGGLTAAACLLKRGCRVRVYEQADQLGEVGAGVQISANASKVLRDLGLEAELERTAVQPEAFEFRRYDTGEILHRLPLGSAHREQHGAPYFQLHRVDLHRALVEAVRRLDPGAIELRARVARATESDDEVSVEFEGRAPVRANALIGADGIKSAVRRHVLGADTPHFTGQVAWRLTIPVERVRPELRPEVVSTVWCGPRNHATMYYLRGGSLLNFAGCVERPWEEESWTAKRPWRELDEDYAGWHPMVRAVIEAADRDQCFRWALNNRPPAARWVTERTALLGDAVHATLPYMAQGAALAIEDSAVLARAMTRGEPLARALKTYESHRAQRAARVVRESTEMGELYHIVDAAEMRRAFAARNIAASRNGWLYPYDPLRAPLDTPA